MLSDIKSECTHIKNDKLERTVHKDQGNRILLHVLYPGYQYEQHKSFMLRKTNHSTFLLPKRVNGPLELLANFSGEREEWGFLSKL